MNPSLSLYALLAAALLAGCSPAVPPQAAVESKQQTTGPSSPAVAQSVADRVATVPAATVPSGKEAERLAPHRRCRRSARC